MGTENVLDITLRKAVPDDSRTLWEWANDPLTRAQSFHPDPIAWENHELWFHHKLEDPACVFYLAADTEGRRVGQVRCDIENGKGTISISVAPASRGRGYAAEMLRLAAAALLGKDGIASLKAYVKEDNRASRSAFEKAGFRDAGPVDTEGHRAILFVMERNPS